MAGVLLMVAAVTTHAGEPPEQFRGSVMVTGGVRAGDRIEIVVHAAGFTGEESIQALAHVLATQGENALLHEIGLLPAAGWIEIGGTHRTELKLVRSLGAGPVRQLRFLTTPPIRYDDLWMMTRSPDYNYGFVELIVDENGVGDGTIMPAAAIEIGDGRIHLAALGSYAFRILNVRREEIQEAGTAEEHQQE